MAKIINSEIQEVVDYLDQIKDDPDTSKKFRVKTEEIITLLTGNSEMAVEKALLALDELSSSDLSSYHRTKIWDVVSMLESTKIN